MNFLGALWHGLGQIWGHKLRSILSILSVFLGVASLIVILGFISGLFVQWETNMYENGGIEKVSVVENFLPKSQSSLKPLSKGRTMEDAEALGKLCHNLATISPEIDFPITVGANAKTYNVNSQGVTPGVFVINRYDVSQGRQITERDVQKRSLVAVIGTKVAEAVFPGIENPVGKTITINGVSFTVVGLLKKYSMKRGDWDVLDHKNRVVFIPITAMMDRFVPTRKLSSLNLKIEDVSLMDQTVKEISNVIVHTHRGLLDFRVETQANQLAAFNSIKGGFEFTGKGIGLVTLLIGGVGITNLMLASVSERMREIGLCKAIGATNADIFIQILAEAICLSALGGALGVATGALAIWILQLLLANSEFSPIFSPAAGAIGFVFSMVIGVIAGLYPAFQASRLDPIEALRYE